jgi:hypothetical protein
MTTMTTQNTQAQVPPAIIDCNGNITCQNPEPWEEINNMSFMYGSCIINPRFKVTKCCDALGNCEYIVEIVEILVGGNNCTPNYDLYKEEAIKFIMAKSPEIFNIGNFNSFNLHLKQPKCMKNEHGNFFTFQYIRMYACDPTSCCLAVYRLNTYYEKINVQNQHPYQYTDFTYCDNLQIPYCEYACFPLDFTPDLDIMFADYGGGQDPCLADCFWRLDGNDNVNSNSYIGTNTDFHLRIKTKTAKDIIFFTNDTPRMWLQKTGRLSIGNEYTSMTEPDILLSVGGKIIATELIVRPDGTWPDYVFDDDYQRLTLKELEKYINSNKSLPGVPTADETQTIEVGKMIPLLLEKIEELTLYLIELNKENEAIKKKFENFQKVE